MIFPVSVLASTATPCYFYDLKLLDATLKALEEAIGDNGNIKVHYALKANSNPLILEPIRKSGLGIDAVSSGEIRMALEAGFNARDIVFAGVGKRDDEIREALAAGIGAFNVESLPELRVISEISTACGKVAPVALRVTPGIDAHTHRYITTGLDENKFGIPADEIFEAADIALSLPGIDLTGLHFHIGSQITDYTPFKMLCERVNELNAAFRERGINLKEINCGGGLGIDYENPDAHPVPDFKGYIDTFRRNLDLSDGQRLHIELGRSIVAQCGSLITRVIYVKEGKNKRFAIVDAGMNDLLRPALYGARHEVQLISEMAGTAISGKDGDKTYDIVGPICESSDVFREEIPMPELHRGDILAIRSAGAYGESMASCYNGRNLPGFLAL